jgi:hypothetical protein
MDSVEHYTFEDQRPWPFDSVYRSHAVQGNTMREEKPSPRVIPNPEPGNEEPA